MKTKPKALNWLAGLLIALAPALPIQIMLLYGHTPMEIEAIAAKLSPLNWAIFLFAPLTGYLVYRASRMSLLALPMLAALVAYNNWFVGAIGEDYAPWVTRLATLGFIGAVGVAFSGEALAAILHPGRRWWMTPARKEAEIPVRLQIHNKQFRGANDEILTSTFDISEGGAFIPFGRLRAARREAGEAAAETASRLSAGSLRAGTQCSVSINVKDTGSIQCRAEIVRVTTSSGRYPAGMGIRFLGLSWEEKRVLGSLVRALPIRSGVEVPSPS